MKYLKKYINFVNENTNDDSFRIENPINPYDNKVTDEEIIEFLKNIFNVYYSFKVVGDSVLVYANKVSEERNMPTGAFKFTEINDWIRNNDADGDYREDSDENIEL